jgi:uncharacterized protein (UPF0332 family)
MKSNDKKRHLAWCLKQKRGIKCENPNDNLSIVYIKKAKSALNMLTSATEKDEVDWIATTAYYARYFAFYALLQKGGITSEIHDCTISLMRFLFVEEEIIDERFYNELRLAKELRVDVQYYVTQELDKEKLHKDAETARHFVLRMEEIIENITQEKINQLRAKLGVTSSEKEEETKEEKK